MASLFVSLGRLNGASSRGRRMGSGTALPTNPTWMRHAAKPISKHERTEIDPNDRPVRRPQPPAADPSWLPPPSQAVDLASSTSGRAQSHFPSNRQLAKPQRHRMQGARTSGCAFYGVACRLEPQPALGRLHPLLLSIGRAEHPPAIMNQSNKPMRSCSGGALRSALTPAGEMSSGDGWRFAEAVCHAVGTAGPQSPTTALSGCCGPPSEPSHRR
jgi:hypothetical protein